MKPIIVGMLLAAVMRNTIVMTAIVMMAMLVSSSCCSWRSRQCPAREPRRSSSRVETNLTCTVLKAATLQNISGREQLHPQLQLSVVDGNVATEKKRIPLRLHLSSSKQKLQ